MDPKLTGQILAQTVKHFIKANNLDSKLCVGIGTDTCNLMLGEQKGTVMELQKCSKKPMRKSYVESFDFKKQQCPCIVQERGANSEKHFRILFASIMKSHATLGVELSVPRITSRQINRPNIVTSDKENHYRLNLYVPLLDNILQDLVYRLNEESLNTSSSLFGHESDINMLKFIIKHIDPLLAILYRSTYIQVTGPYSKPGNYNRRTKIREERGYTFHVKVPVMTTLKTDNTGNGW
ncbi:unnamed protein product [Acanthoscelides obtectus]|uniref:Uncharacterized protein n=1 Tax=Acanthoscelides obtectus TaxID=200917 RepID=A0A9P0M299_ACAOB|nr:unnamed protein product [Acanthoscelides obtectus]CAK1649759.1 hypothetical protein AOBTE_LOCUS16408 [Acanthoscelides obtectus]